MPKAIKINRKINQTERKSAKMRSEDRIKLIERVQTLEGITDDERAALLGLLRESKTYGLVWEDKPEDVEDRLREELPVLIEDTDKAIIGGGQTV